MFQHSALSSYALTCARPNHHHHHHHCHCSLLTAHCSLLTAHCSAYHNIMACRRVLFGFHSFHCPSLTEGNMKAESTSRHWAVTFIPMSMPKTVCRTYSYNKIIQLVVCGAFSGRGMGTTITAQTLRYVDWKNEGRINITMINL